MRITQSVVFALLGLAAGHPGEEESEHELQHKRDYNIKVRRGLEGCADAMEKRGINARAEARRAATLEKYRKMVIRDTDTVLNTSHLSDKHYNAHTPDNVVFSESSTCVLNPEGEAGPYWVTGEYIRSNLRETEPGVPVILEGQFLDVETCEPITDIWWDLWNCNATGVYAGIVATGNGNGLDDPTNINNTFLRGIQKVDHDGVATFESIFPGHYSGRATHNHMVAHLNATRLPNNTLAGGTEAHVGQFFWDQDLISKVEATYPYNTNNITITTNAEDRVFGDETADSTSDPVFNYAYLGDKLEDGLFAWVTIVINTKATYEAAYADIWTASGGVAASESSSTGGGEGEAPGGNSTNTTSGAVPSASLARRAFEIDWR